MLIVKTENIALVYHWTSHLTQDLMPPVRQFPGQSRFVSLFFQSTTKFAVDFNCGIDYLASQTGMNASVICLSHITSLTAILPNSETPSSESNFIRFPHIAERAVSLRS